MKREKIVSMALTDEEYGLIVKGMAEAMVKTGNSITISTFMRDYIIKPWANGSQPEVPAEKPKDSISKEFDDINF